MIFRKVEPELFPCLRKFGIAFYEFNPRMSCRNLSYQSPSLTLTLYQLVEDSSLAATAPLKTKSSPALVSTPTRVKARYVIQLHPLNTLSFDVIAQR